MKTRHILSILLIVPILAATGLNAAPTDKDVKNITKKVFPTVVRVETRNHVRKVASGVVVDREGHVITTALITPRDEKIFVVTRDGERLEADFLGADAETHLAVIKVKEGKISSLDFAEAEDLEPGAWIGVVSISPDNKPIITQGIVSSVDDDSLRLNVWVVRGASGSPVVDEKGRMVGLLRGAFVDEFTQFTEGEAVSLRYMFSRGESPSSGLAMAIPSDTVQDVYLQIKEKGKVERGWMGVSIGLNEEGEVEIADVDRDSPAELAGLEAGDTILAYGGREVPGSEWLAKAIRKNKPGDTVELTISREGEERSVDVRLGEYTRDSMIMEFERKFPLLFQPDPKDLKEFFMQPFPERTPLRRGQEFYRWQGGKRKYIGVYIQEVNEELAAFFGAPEGLGVLINKVDEDSPAEKAGIKVGDVVVKADGREIRSATDLMVAIQQKDKDETISLEIIRDKKQRTVEVKVEADQSSEGGGFTWFFNKPNLY